MSAAENLFGGLSLEANDKLTVQDIDNINDNELEQ
jgi:hypothetical protein